MPSKTRGTRGMGFSRITPEPTDLPKPRTLYFDDAGSDKAQAMRASGLVHTVVEGKKILVQVDLGLIKKTRITFGSAEDNDIVVKSSSNIVSRYHGVLLVMGQHCTIMDMRSTNGLYVNGVKRAHSAFTPRDVAWIGLRESLDQDIEGIVMLLSYDTSEWYRADFNNERRIAFGRDEDNDVVLSSPVVSAHHAVIFRDAKNSWAIVDTESYNGTYVNGAPVVGTVPLFKGDVVSLADVTMVFMDSFVVFNVERDEPEEE